MMKSDGIVSSHGTPRSPQKFVQKKAAHLNDARLLLRLLQTYFVSSISGKPSFPAPMITIFALVDVANFSVASIPFHLSN